MARILHCKKREHSLYANTPTRRNNMAAKKPKARLLSHSEKPLTAACAVTTTLYFARKICLDRALQAGTWARTECHGGRPILWKKIESRNKNKKQKCHTRPAWASCSSGRTMSHNSGSTSNKPQFSQRV